MAPHIHLQRVTEKGLVRYYRIGIFATLFGDFVLEREYGNVQNKKATGYKRVIFDNLQEAKKAFQMLLLLKQKKGYQTSKN
jgi:predicted DNA-binding WGR domain protein